jgi:2-isopropylmalate synthase
MANALAAIRAGATWISSSVNGIGERCGITDTITLMANLHYEFNYPLPKEGQLKKLSRLVSGISRQSISMQHNLSKALTLYF